MTVIGRVVTGSGMPGQNLRVVKRFVTNNFAFKRYHLGAAVAIGYDDLALKRSAFVAGIVVNDNHHGIRSGNVSVIIAKIHNLKVNVHAVDIIDAFQTLGQVNLFSGNMINRRRRLRQRRRDGVGVGDDYRHLLIGIIAFLIGRPDGNLVSTFHSFVIPTKIDDFDFDFIFGSHVIAYGNEIFNIFRQNDIRACRMRYFRRLDHQFGRHFVLAATAQDDRNHRQADKHEYFFKCSH